jgi:hypothetical protein
LQIKREFLICERIAGIFVAGDIIVLCGSPEAIDKPSNSSARAIMMIVENPWSLHLLSIS